MLYSNLQHNAFENSINQICVYQILTNFFLMSVFCTKTVSVLKPYLFFKFTMSSNLIICVQIVCGIAAVTWSFFLWIRKEFHTTRFFIIRNEKRVSYDINKNCMMTISLHFVFKMIALIVHKENLYDININKFFAYFD